MIRRLTLALFLLAACAYPQTTVVGGGTTVIGGGVATAPYCTVAYSATPTFDASICNVFAMTLTGNVTSFTVTGATGTAALTQTIAFIWTQDGTGSRTVSGAPASFKNFMSPVTTASTKSIQYCQYDGTNFVCSNRSVAPANTPAIVGQAITGYSSATGIFTQAAVGGGSSAPVDCSAGITAGTYGDLKACVDAVIAAGGGVAQVLTPGTYTISTSIKLGSATAIGDATNTKVTLLGGPGVFLDCAVTDYSDCLRLADGAAIIGYSKGAAVTAMGRSFTILVHGTAGTHINNVIAPMIKDGSIESNTVDGMFIVGSSTATILQSLLDVRAVFASSSYRNISTANVGNADAIHVHNASQGNLSLSGNLTGSGTVATVTTAASTTSERDGHHVWVDGTVTVSGCADTSFNGTGMKVLSILSNTSFTYQAAGAVGASSATCTVHPVATSLITSVILFDNIWANCSAFAGCRPMVINSYGQGDVGAITIHNAAFEGAATGLAGLLISRDNDGTGATLESIALTGAIHCEPDAADTTTILGVSVSGPVNGVTIDSIDGSGANAANTGNLLNVATNTVTNFSVRAIKNLGWANTINAPNAVFKETVIHGYRYTGAIAIPEAGDVCGGPTMFCFTEYFPHGGVSELVTQAVGGGTLTATAASGKGLTFTTNAAAGQGANIGFLTNAAGQAAYLGSTTPWVNETGFSISQTADTTFFAGLGVSAANPPANGIGCGYDTHLSQTTFFFNSWVAGVVTSQNTAVTVVAGTNYRCTIQGTGTSGKVTMTLRNADTGAILYGPKTVCPAGCDVTATLATAASLSPWDAGLISATGGAGAAKAMILWYASFRNWGLTQ